MAKSCFALFQQIGPWIPLTAVATIVNDPLNWQHSRGQGVTDLGYPMCAHEVM